jgi:ATP-binding cassette, subfamily B, bacterial
MGMRGFGGGMGGMGGMFGGGAWGRAGSAPGLPFAGIPPELKDGVDALLSREPDHGVPSVRFTHQETAADRHQLSLWRLLAHRWQYGIVAVILVGIVSVANQAGPLLVSLAIDDGMLKKDMLVVGLAAIAYATAIGISASAQWGQTRTTGRMAAWVMNDLRNQIFIHIQRLGLDFYTNEMSGVIMSRMTADIENLQQLLQDGLAQMAVQGLTMIVILAVLFTLNLRLAWIAVALVVPALTAASLWFRWASQRAYNRVRDEIALMLADLSENLHGIRTVTAHNRQAHNIVAHRNVVGDYREANNLTARIAALYGPGTQALGYLGQAGLLAVGGDMVVTHSLSLGALVAFFLYLNRFMSPIQLLVQQYNTFQQGHSSIYKLRTLLAIKPDVPEAPDAVELPPIHGDITFDHVSFAYGSGAPVLHDVNLRINAGETIAFVGQTGAGKSTMAKLVTRFYDPTEGRILLDGYDLRDVTVDSLRRQLGVVPQEPFLFANTLRYNIAYARPNAPEEEIWEAVRAAQLTELVERLPDGLDTVLQERGQSLSSGERQLVALARAFHARPRVLVLDEATSNLDLASEAKIEAALDKLLEARTAILIAHRLSTAMKADRVVVVDDGQIVEIGSHDELVASGGIYAGMYATWMSHTQEAA